MAQGSGGGFKMRKEMELVKNIASVSMLLVKQNKDLKQELAQQKALLGSAIKVIEKMSRNHCQCFVLEEGKCTPCAFLEKVKPGDLK